MRPAGKGIGEDMSRTSSAPVIRVVLLAAVLAFVAAPAAAQVVHSLTLGAGIFTPRSADNRATGDTLVADLNQPIIPWTDPPATGSLAFDIKDFRSFPVFAEWGIAFGNHVEIGIGGAYANQSVQSVYRDLINGQGTEDPSDDTEIPQTLRLQTIPLTGLVRFLGGRPGHFQPYVGGGVVAVVFKYTESGEFVDTSDGTVFNDKFVANGVAFGPVVVGGARVPLGGDVYALTFEGGYQWAVGKTGGFDNGFLGDKLDLGGWSLNFGFLIRF
jgi:hypothetical protein